MGRMSEEQFEEFLRQSNQYLRRQIDDSKVEFGLGEYERFDWDQWWGELVFSDGGVPKVVADIQFVGSYSKKSGTWLWAWANPTYLEPVRSATLLHVKEFGRENGLTKLTQANWKADEADGWEMTAITARLLEARGAYRSPGENGYSFMVFTGIRKAAGRDYVFATFTCSHIVEQKHPVLYVTKEADGSAQLLCGGVHESTERGRVIHLDHLLEADVTLNDLADLPVGWSAERTTLGGPWQRSKAD